MDVLVFYALGLGQTSPPASDGQAAPFAQVAPPPTRMVSGETIIANTGVTAIPMYAGLTPGSVGLYQVNVLVPANSEKGNAVPVFFDMGGGAISNSVTIAIQ